MKKRILSFLIILVMAIGMLPTIAMADTVTSGTCGENVTWSFDENTGTLTIDGTGEMDYYEIVFAGSVGIYSSAYPWFYFDITSVVIKDGVTSIAAGAFADFENLTSIIIPDSLTSIYYAAFAFCDNLTSVNYCGSETDRANIIVSEMNDTLTNASWVYNYFVTPDTDIPVTSGTCGENVTWSFDETTGTLTIDGTGDMHDYTIIGGFSTDVPWITFKDDIVSVVINSGVSLIGDNSFSYCYNLTTITIPDSVTTIGNNSFYACLSLKSITIPDSVTTIGAEAFYDCTSLESITIPDGMTTIGDYVFCGCESLESITMPYSVTSIGDCTFLCCYSLETVSYHGTEQDRANIQIGNENYCFLNATWNYHEHKYDNACDADCNICGKTRTITHTFGAYISDNNATTEADGTKTRTCSVCGAKDTVTDVGSKLPVPEPKPEDKPTPEPEEKPVEIVDTTKVFTDIKAKKWYTNAVNYAYSHGFIAGVSDTEFGRDVPVTRGMFITILARIAGVDTGKTANKVTTKFTDVKSGKYYTAAIKWASENGVVNGLTDTTFGPNSAIERQQLCTMIVNFAKYMKIDLKASQTEIKFTDASAIRKYAKNAVATCQKAGIVSGYAVDGGTEFKPLNTATRAEAAQILYKFHKDFVA